MAFNRDIPFVGFHTRIADHDSVPGLIRLIEEGLAPMGFNTLILEFNPGFRYRCFPEFSNGTLDFDDAVQIREVCRKHNIRPVPLFQCLSHQSNFGPKPWPLYEEHPELLETPGIPRDAGWPDFYCHSWCASNDDIYQYVFPMIDELIEAFQPEAFHIGLDEVFEIGEEECPRCKGKDKAALFARAVKILHDYLTEKGIETMMWGDRLLDAEKLGYQMWEADKFGMYPAFDRKDEVTRDIMICDWHYDLHDHGYPSIGQFMEDGFFTIPSIASDLEQCKHFWGFCLEFKYLARKFKWPGKLGGILCTHWSPLTPQGVEDLLKGIQGQPVDFKEKYSSARTGNVIRNIIPQAKNFKKVY
jgi:hypothetical protein